MEGGKNILEVLDSDFRVHSLYVTENFYYTNTDQLSRPDLDLNFATGNQLASAGSFKINEQGLAVVKITKNQPIRAENDEFALILDEIKDPGNMGTIIRICDWYGIHKIIASNDTVDIYNPKVIAATMGSFTRVKVYYTNLPEFITANKGPYIGTFMTGENIHQFEFGSHGYIIMGNESSGIQPTIADSVNHRIMIPSFGNAESLNVGVAAAVILDNLRRE